MCKRLALLLALLQDFGDSIPGHGGMTDEMDCQVSNIFSEVSTEKIYRSFIHA